MEFSDQQNNQLKQLKDMVKFQNLQAKCEELKGDIENLIAERADCLSKSEKLMERLASIHEEYKIARKQELLWVQKMTALNKSCVDYKNYNDNLQNLCSVLGYHISKCELLENNGLQVTLHYQDTCYVTYRETGQEFDLIDIFPQYFDFAKIQEFLRDTQDLRGLLACLRKFFDMAIKLKEMQEKK